MSDSMYFYCPDCHGTFELRNYEVVTGMKYQKEQQDIFCPICGNTHCVQVESDIWHIEYAFERVRDAEEDLKERAEELLREVNKKRVDAHETVAEEVQA